MFTHPLITYELAVAHDQDLIENAAAARFAAGCGAAGVLPTTIRIALSAVGSLLIATGERLGGARVPRPTDLVGVAR